MLSAPCPNMVVVSAGLTTDVSDPSADLWRVEMFPGVVGSMPGGVRTWFEVGGPGPTGYFQSVSLGGRVPTGNVIAYLNYRDGRQFTLGFDPAILQEGRYLTPGGVKDSLDDFSSYAANGCG
jgi:hypothetical protein